MTLLTLLGKALKDVNDKFLYFYGKVSSCVKRHAPLEKVKPKMLSFKDKPWISFRIQRMMIKRDKSTCASLERLKISRLSICTKNLEIKLFQRQGKTELIILTTTSILTKTT